MFSQKSAVVPKKRASLSAVSAVTPRFPLTISLTAAAVIPTSRARRA
jgi:hypothetical protein